MINDVLQWTVIALIVAFVVYPKVHQIVKDFKEEEDE